MPVEQALRSRRSIREFDSRPLSLAQVCQLVWAAQNPEDPVVLVLSRFAGAAFALTDALLVDPHDTSAPTQAIQRTLEMPLAERQRRWKSMMSYPEDNDAHGWRRAFVEALESAYAQRRAVQAAQAA